MNLTVLTPEEEILETFKKSITEELNTIIEEINMERSEIWLNPIKEITTIEERDPSLPSIYMTIGEVTRITKDNNFTEETYTLTLKITFKDNKTRTSGYRYNYALNQLIKNSTELPQIADRILIKEMTYNQNQRGDNREPSNTVFKINIVKET
ncbi:MAG: hypothetical protein JEY99_15180 [Spirochaetales bacterium]|nr:hypothetical protein [Spirochaetales bacterium]